MSTATQPTWQDEIRAQVERAADDLILTDEIMLQKPWLVVAHTDTAHELVDRFASQPEAVTAAAQMAQGAGEHYAEISVTTLGDVGWGPKASVTELPPATPSDEVAESEADGGHADESGQPTLIDRSQYEREDLAIPKIDGQQVDRIAFTFSGTVYLDRSDPVAVRLYNATGLATTDITLKIGARCSGTAGKLATDKGGELDVVVGTKTVKVESVDLPAGA